LAPPEEEHVDVHERHRADERGDVVGESELEVLGPFRVEPVDRRVV
jgi:hypothetical protein